MTATNHKTEPTSFLEGMSPTERQHFKDTYRRSRALDAGANTEQLASLKALERGFNTHHPVYRKGADGSVQVTYTAPATGTVTAHVRPDGLLHVHA